MRKIIGSSIFLIMLMAVCLLANPSDFNNGYFASAKTKKCYQAYNTPYGDIRPSNIISKWGCIVNKEDPGGRLLQLVCYQSPQGAIGFYYSKTYGDCIGLLQAME